MTDLHLMTATQLVSAFRDKDLSPVEVAEYLLGRIEAFSATLLRVTHELRGRVRASRGGTTPSAH